MAEETSPQDARTKVWELIGHFSAVMLVTASESGDLNARPMSHIVRSDDHAIYILTEHASDSARDIDRGTMALLTFADNKRYVSVPVRGAVSSDRTLIKDLWNPGAQAFWPDGPADPAVCALVLRPQSAEYWDGDNSLTSGVKMLIADVTGNRPDLGDHGEVRM